MTPLNFDPATAREVVGDDQARIIEARARADADSGVEAFAPFEPDSGATYWSQVKDEMRAIVYREQFTKRLARNARKAGASSQ